MIAMYHYAFWARFTFILSIFTIFIIGLVMIYSTTSGEILDQELSLSLHHGLVKQMVNALIGFGVGYLAYKGGIRRVLRITPYLFFFSVLLLTLTLIPGIGYQVNGARRWLSLGGIVFQPSEITKVVIPLFFVHCYEKQNGFSSFRSFLKTSILCLIPLSLILVEPNTGTAAVIAMTLCVLCFMTRIPLKFWVLPLLCVVLVGGIFAAQLPYVSARMKVFFNPELDKLGRGHQPYQAKVATGSGRLLGLGPGKSWQKLSFLPEAQNDYIGAIFAEEWGFAGVLTLILLYSLVIYLGFYFTYHSNSISSFAIGTTLCFLLAFQVFLNLGVVSGLVPSTGLNLPFFSQGGSSLIGNCFGMGLLVGLPCKNK